MKSNFDNASNKDVQHIKRLRRSYHNEIRTFTRQQHAHEEKWLPVFRQLGSIAEERLALRRVLCGRPFENYEEVFELVLQDFRRTEIGKQYTSDLESLHHAASKMGKALDAWRAALLKGQSA